MVQSGTLKPLTSADSYYCDHNNLFQSMVHKQIKIFRTMQGVRDFVDAQSIDKETSKFSLIDRALTMFHTHVQYDIGRLQPTLEKLRTEAECLKWYVKSIFFPTLPN